MTTVVIVVLIAVAVFAVFAIDVAVLRRRKRGLAAPVLASVSTTLHLLIRAIQAASLVAIIVMVVVAMAHSR